MTTRDIFIDAMSGIDEDLLTAHIQIKQPTKAQKIRKYAMAAAIYAAACLVVAIILPFIIGHGEDPSPVPGNDPVKVETTDPAVTDPEVRQIKVADIDTVYNGVDSENLSDKVTLDEVKAIISAARQAYADYDVIVLADGTLMPTKAKLSDYTLAQIEKMTDDARDMLFEEYKVYFDNMLAVVEEMLEVRFPENSIYRRNLDDDTCYFVLNLPDTGYVTAEEMFDPIKERDDDLYREWLYISDLIDPGTLYYLDSNAEEREMLYPTAEEYEIRKAVEEWRVEREIPKAVAAFDGLRYTISLDKESYGLYDEIAAYVQIENIGDKAVALWQPVLSHYIYDVRFYEDGVEKPEFWAQQWDYPEAEESRFLRPGQAITIIRTFTPGTPRIEGTERAGINSLWEIKAYVKYLPDPPEDLSKLPVEDLKTGSVTVEVPHEDYEKGKVYVSIPTADSMLFGSDGKIAEFVQNTSEYGGMKSYLGKLFIESTTEQIALDMTDSDVAAIKQDDFVELVYGTEQRITFAESNEQTIAFTRLLIPLSGDNEFAMILGKEAHYSECAVYVDETVVKNLRRDVKEFVEAALAEDEMLVTEPENMIVGIGSDSATLTKDSEYFEQITMCVNEMVTDAATAQIYLYVNEAYIADIKENQAYVEYVYTDKNTINFGGFEGESAPFDSLLFSLTGDSVPVMILGRDGSYTRTSVYAVGASAEVVDAVKDIVSK